MDIPMVAVVGRKGSGKTYLLTKLIPVFGERGYQVGTIKRAPPHFEIDYQGKDSYLHKAAGASQVLISSSQKMALIKDVNKEAGPEEAAGEYFQGVDIVFVEGFKESALPKIEVYRTHLEEPPLFASREVSATYEVMAVVADDPSLETPLSVPLFSFAEVEKLADFLEVQLTQRFLKGRGEAKMIDVSRKPDTERVALAKGTISMSPTVLERVVSGKVEKGDVLAVAQVAGIMAAKRTPELIPLCHPLQIDKVSVRFEVDKEKGEITVYTEVKSTGKTGVEMEALIACATALLTIYDMCKSLERGMMIKELELLEKQGGRSGRWVRE